MNRSKLHGCGAWMAATSLLLMLTIFVIFALLFVASALGGVAH